MLDLFRRKEYVITVDARPVPEAVQAEIRQQLGQPPQKPQDSQDSQNSQEPQESQKSQGSQGSGSA